MHNSSKHRIVKGMSDGGGIRSQIRSWQVKGW
jgi:hypothetical protein